MDDLDADKGDSESGEVDAVAVVEDDGQLQEMASMGLPTHFGTITHNDNVNVEECDNQTGLNKRKKRGGKKGKKKKKTGKMRMSGERGNWMSDEEYVMNKYYLQVKCDPVLACIGDVYTNCAPSTYHSHFAFSATCTFLSLILAS